MTDKTASTVVVHNEAASRFETTVDGHLAVAGYMMLNGVMVMPHTLVPRALEGRGIAAKLVQAALGHARTQGLKVDPRCSYVDAYINRHPEVQDLRA